MDSTEPLDDSEKIYTAFEYDGIIPTAKDVAQKIVESKLSYIKIEVDTALKNTMAKLKDRTNHIFCTSLTEETIDFSVPVNANISAARLRKIAETFGYTISIEIENNRRVIYSISWLELTNELINKELAPYQDTLESEKTDKVQISTHKITYKQRVLNICRSVLERILESIPND